MKKNYWKQEDALKTALAYFDAHFFLLCMGTGVLAVNLQVLPYQFPGLGILSVIVWLLDLLLFSIITSLFTARWIFFPASTLKHFREEPEQTVYLSTIAISFSTLLEMTAIVLGKTWNGWDIVVMVLWYCDVAISVSAVLVSYWIMFRMEHVKVENLPPTALYPATGILSTASSGSVVVAYSSLSVRASQPILILSMILLGFGFFLALAILANYTGRLLQAHTPPAEKAMASFIPIAALSNAGYAAVSLGRLAGPQRNLFAEYGQGYSADANVGLAIYGAGLFTSLALLGFATYWMLLSFFVVIDDIKDAPFNLNYWSALYPFGFYALQLGQLAMDFDSPAFRTLCTAFVIILLLFWFFCAGMTIPRLVTGEIPLMEAEEKKASRESWSDLQQTLVAERRQQQQERVQEQESA